MSILRRCKPATYLLAVGIVLITLLGFFTVPGHTYLQSDTQIYIPMMERLWDPSTYPGDLVAAKPHLSYTIYDEVTAAFRWLTHTSFETALIVQQLVFRALQVFGVYLLATTLFMSRRIALALTALVSMGAIIAGPAVLLIEFEPVPRGFATGLTFLAIGLAATGRRVWASTAASLAFLYHAPTTIPFWICFLPIVFRRRQWKALAPLASAVFIISVASLMQSGVVEHQHFWMRLDPELERIQRLRTAYNWVSNWPATLLLQYTGLWLLSLLAYWRVRPKCGRVFLLGLPLIGMLSVPVSYLLLEHMKWALVSQVQPARALLFVTAMALILSAAASFKAVERGRMVEAALWLFPVFAIPMKNWTVWPDALHWLLAAALAIAISLLAAYRPAVPLGFAIAACYFVMPVLKPRPIETSDLTQLVEFARNHTSRNAMFLFADVGHGLQPGVFRARALRSVYVDWKAGGQVNYYRSLADDWWRRWTEVNALQYTPQQFPGIDYLVLTSPHRALGHESVFHNNTYTVYHLKYGTVESLPSASRERPG